MSESVTGGRGRPAGDLLAKLVAPATVFAGGLAGSGVRAGILLTWPVGSGAFPVPTLVINVLGALLLGLFLARRQRSVAGPASLRFWAVGVLGSFTTFSLFSFEVLQLVEDGFLAMAVWYAAASTFGGVTAAILGQRLGETGR